MLGARAGDAANMLRDWEVNSFVAYERRLLNVTPRIFTEEVRSMSGSGGGGA